jgi:hypothetical protein
VWRQFTHPQLLSVVPFVAESGDDDVTKMLREDVMKKSDKFFKKVKHPSSHLNPQHSINGVKCFVRLPIQAYRIAAFAQIADGIAGKDFAATPARLIKAHKKPITCIALTSDDSTCFSGAKDCCVVKVDVETGQKTVRTHHNKQYYLRRANNYLMQTNSSRLLFDSQIIRGDRSRKGTEGHLGHVLAVAVSDDNRLLATGGNSFSVNGNRSTFESTFDCFFFLLCHPGGAGMDKVVKVWDVRTCKLVKEFEGHRDAVSALTFRKGSTDLYSGSYDRCVKVCGYCHVDSCFAFYLLIRLAGYTSGLEFE